MISIRWFLVLILPLALLIGVACGGDGEEEAASAPEAAATEAPAATAAPTTAAPTTAGAAPTEAAAAQATATPRPAAVATQPPAGAEPVAGRLKIAFRVPVDQVVVPYKAFITSPLMRPDIRPADLEQPVLQRTRADVGHRMVHEPGCHELDLQAARGALNSTTRQTLKAGSSRPRTWSEATI